MVLVWPRRLGIEISLRTGDHSDRDTGGLSLGGRGDLDCLEDEYCDCEGGDDGDGGEEGDGSAWRCAGARVVPAMMGRQGLVSYARPWRGEAWALAASGARAGRRLRVTGRSSAPASSWSPSASGSAENTAELRATSWYSRKLSATCGRDSVTSARAGLWPHLVCAHVGGPQVPQPRGLRPGLHSNPGPSAGCSVQVPGD